MRMTGRQIMVWGFVLYGLGAALLASDAASGIYTDITNWVDGHTGGDDDEDEDEPGVRA